jgi:hypothetical protein
MTMSLLAGIDLTTKNADAVEELGANAGILPAGVYQAQLVAAKPLSGDDGGKGFEMQFEIVAPEMFKGATIKDSMWQPKPGNPKQETRVLLVYHRLGLLQKTEKDGKKTYTPVEGLIDIPDVIGRSYFVNVNIREYTPKDGGTKQRVNGLDFEAIIKPNDERAKKLGPLPVTVPAGTGTSGAAANGAAGRKHDYSDL